MNFDIQKINKYVKGSDTDSTFICLEPILKKIYPNLDLDNKDEVILKIKPIQAEIGELLNNYQSKISKDILNCTEHSFDLKPEFIVQTAYWSGKRRYAQYLVDREGQPIEKFIMMGLDIMKSNFPKLFKDFGENLIKKILFNIPKSQIDKEILEFKKSINTVDWKKLIKPTGVKNLNNYIVSKPLNGEIFSKIAKRCPINTRGAIVFNDFIRFKKVDKKYSPFQAGDKMYLSYLKPNPYGIDVIGSNGYNDPPEVSELINKYIDRNKIFESTLQNKIENLYKDIGWGGVIFNQNINKYFQFME